MILRATLKNRMPKSGKAEDYEKYKKQGNLIVKMNRKAKFDFYSSIEPRSIDNDKKFWKMVKPMFSNSNEMGEKIVLTEERMITSDDTMIAECLNSHFTNITDSLELVPMFEQVPNYVELDEKVSLALAKYNNHPSTITMKRNISITQKFELSRVCPWEVMKFVEVLDTSKSTSGDIPTKILKMAKENMPLSTDCINAVIYNCTFPDELKKAGVSAIFKRGDPCCEENCRPIIILAALSKIYKRSMGVQMNTHFNGILSALLSGFRQGYSAQHAYFVQRHLEKMP